MKNKETGYSLAVKLNLRMSLSILSVLICINIFLFFAAPLITLWQAEENALFLIENEIKNVGALKEYAGEASLGYAVNKSSAAELEGRNHFKLFNNFSPLKNYEVIRSINLENEQKINFENSSRAKYDMVFVEEKVTVSFDIGREISIYKEFFKWLLILECVLFLIAVLKASKNIRRTLRPITEITKRTQNLSKSPNKPISDDEIKRMREFAGAIGDIDATTLDKRLPVDGAQKELKDLADAINNMLNRIDDAYKSQVRFVSDASHELRTPIAVVQGYANLLDRWGKNDQETMQEAIDAIKSEAENMKDLIEQLLFLARGDNETLSIYPEIFDTAEMIDEIINETKMIDFSHDLRKKEGLPVFINADRQLLKQALRILIDNSIKYTPDGGEISVSVTEENGNAKIIVMDNGIGIDPKSLPYIFERFYRADESRARKTGGSGLGLSIMKWIIDRHNGTIEVVSRKDIGTKTTIIIQAAPQKT